MRCKDSYWLERSTDTKVRCAIGGYDRRAPVKKEGVQGCQQRRLFGVDQHYSSLWLNLASLLSTVL